MCERLFMYEDDVDLCWRVRLTGWTVMFCPDAVVWHEYEFDKGTMKWYWLERNRLWTVLSNYSAITLVLLAPLLLGTELMVTRPGDPRPVDAQAASCLGLGDARSPGPDPMASPGSARPPGQRSGDHRADVRARRDVAAG